MILVNLFRFAIISLLLWVLITQVIIPVIRNTVLFPIFLKEEKLLNTLEKVNQKVEEQELLTEIEKKVETLDN